MRPGWRAAAGIIEDSFRRGTLRVWHEWLRRWPGAGIPDFHERCGEDPVYPVHAILAWIDLFLGIACDGGGRAGGA